jgi:hypothetical protein
MKKLLSSLTIATTLVLSATAAFADNRVADHRTDRPGRTDHRPLPPPVVAPSPVFAPKPVFAPRPAPPIVRQTVLASRLANARRGTLTMAVNARTAMRKDLYLLTTDPRLDIRSVKIRYASGRTVTLRGSAASALDIPDHGRIKLVSVSYINRGARGARVQLMARADRRPGWIG